MSIPATPSSYTDFSDLAALRKGAKGENSLEALEQTAQQFEAIFVQMMLKSMRDAGGGEGGLFDNDHSRLYQDMFDKELSLSMSQADNGIGLAKVLVQQLKAAIPELNQASEQGGQGAVGGLQPQNFSVPPRGQQHFSRQETKEPVAEAEQSGKAMPPVAAPARFDSPEDFVTRLWPHAVDAARELNVDPRAIIAQAALETGWGKSVIRHEDGTSSHNLFNIKADHRWDGDKVNIQTLEYRDGVAAKERAWFRAYDSFEESFADYVGFLRANPRYQHALESGPDIAVFSERLQQAGYATDPAYASKIQRIADGEIIGSAVTELKLTPDKTLS